MNYSPYEKTNCFEFPDELEVKLFNVFKSLNEVYGATYMSYTFDSSNLTRYCFRTDSKWASIYQKEKIKGKPLIELCPLDIVSRERKSRFIIWDLYTHVSQPKAYREIMGMRQDIGLSHGLTLSTYFNNHHDALAVATDNQRYDLATNVLFQEQTEALQKYLRVCRTEFTNYLAKTKNKNDKNKN